MNSHKFSKQIRREAKSHPLKATILGILALLAVGYWTLLACSWVADGNGKGGKSGNVKEVNETLAKEHNLPANLDPQKILAAELAKTMQPLSDTASVDWKQIVQWMKNDNRTAAAVNLPGRADAFEEPFEEEEKTQEKGKNQKPENQPENRVRHEPTPRELEMELSGTLLGAGGGAAVINGKTCRIGGDVTSEKDQRQTKFTLSEIHDRHVVLTRGDKKYKLPMPERKLSDSISIKIKKTAPF